jgi:mono/diheme cytochrome c family protein
MNVRLLRPAMLLAVVSVAGGAIPRAQEAGPVKMQPTEYDMAKVAQPSTLTPVELQGRHLFFLRCAACHTDETNSYGPRLDQARVKTLTEAAVRTKIGEGSRRMPGFRYMLDQAQVDQLLAYLKTIPPYKTQ